MRGRNIDFGPNVQRFLPEGLDPGGRFFLGPNGERLYQPPMPIAPPGMAQAQVMPPAINLDTGEPVLNTLPNPSDIPDFRPDDLQPQFPDADVDLGMAGDVVPGSGETGGEESGSEVVTDPVPAVDTGPAPIRPVLGQQEVSEVISDPLVRSLYFGTEDTPGFFNQLQQAAASAIQQQIPLQQTAGLTPLEQTAIDRSVAGLGGFEPFLQQQQRAIEEAVGLERAGGALMQPYFSRAEQQFGTGLGSLLQSLGQTGPSAREFQRASLVGFDPRSAGAFFNPFEEQVVQRTIDDVLRAGEIRDIEQRARDIQAGGESAFGSRARLTAAERQRALGKGLGEALAGIRSGGFQQALGQAQRESEFQRGGLERAASFESGLGARELEARRGFGQDLLNVGGQRSQLARSIGQNLAAYGRDIGALGRERQDLAQKERRELMGLGQVQRGILDTQLARQFEQQRKQMDRPLSVLGQVGSLLPGYQQASTKIGSAYGLPTDPAAGGLGAGLSLYSGLVNPKTYGN